MVKKRPISAHANELLNLFATCRTKNNPQCRSFNLLRLTEQKFSLLNWHSRPD